MKKLFFLLVICLLLTGCYDSTLVRGRVTEVNLEPGVGLVSFVVESDSGQNMGVLLTDETYIVSWVEGYSAEDFREGDIIGLEVMTAHGGSRQMKTSTGETIRAYNAEEIHIESAPVEQYTMSDGSAVIKHESIFYNEYIASDGTKLLREKANSGPEYVTVENLESYENLSKTAQEKVSAYYNAMGGLYDPETYLELAYADYLNYEEKENFHSYLIGQEISPCAYNDTLIFFRTVVTLPVDSGEITELHFCTAFDKKTGEAVATEQLFTCDMEQALMTILAAAKVRSEAAQQDAAKAFSWDMVVFTPESIEVVFEKGSLAVAEYAWAVSVEYTPEILEILQPWAVPN